MSTIALLFNKLDAGYEVQGASEPLDADVRIPAAHNDVPVLHVANAAFPCEEKPETLEFEQGILEIGAGAFEAWPALKKIEFPPTLVAIKERAFARCASLQAIDLPDSVQSIEAFAFADDRALKTANLPKRLRMLGIGAFAGATALEEFAIDPSNPNFMALDGALFSKDGRVLVAYPANKPDEEYALPKGVVEIAPYAFSGAQNLKRIELPDTIQTIQEAAFEDSAIEEIIIPKELSYVGARAFANCVYLKNFVAPEKGELRLIQGNAFANCRSLQTVVLPENLKEIGARAFFNCVELTRLRIPTQIKNLPDEIVAGCEKLRAIILPDGLQIIGHSAFLGCRSLEEPTLPSKVTRICSFAFQNCSSLVSITLPSALKTLEIGVFAGAEKLAFVSLDASNESYAVNDGAIFTKDGAKLVCYPAGLAQNTYFIPETVTEIAARAFSCAKNLQSISILNNVTKIGEGAFENCSGLLAVVVPSSVPQLANSLFENCVKLRSATLYPTLVKIGARAFAGCENLSTITLPDALEELGDFAFEGCRSLTSLTLGARLVRLGTQPFRRCDSLVDLRVDKTNARYVVKSDALLSADETALVALLPTFTDATYAVKKGVEKIYSYAFASDALIKVELPESVAHVGIGAFADATKLETISVSKKNATFAARDGALYTADYKRLVAVPHAANIKAKALVGVDAIRCDAFLGVSHPQWNAQRAALKNVSFLARESYPSSFQPFAESNDANGSETDGARQVAAALFDWEPIDDATARITGARPQEKRVEFPDVVDGRDVVEIAPKTFYSDAWNAVEEIRLPSKLKAFVPRIDDLKNSFASLLAVEIDESNAFFQSLDGALFSKDGSKLVFYPCGKKEPVYLVPATVVEIEERAFANAENLVSVILPPSLETLKRRAFAQCRRLASVVPPPTTRSIEEGAFLGCGALVMAQIPHGVETIEPSTFQECDSLISVVIPDGVVAIGANAFAKCDKLASVSLPPSVREIGVDAFAKTTLLQAAEGSYAEIWALQNGRPFRAL